MTDMDTAITGLRDLVHIASAVLLGVSSSAFVIGLLIVNLRLAHYGMHSLEIDRAEYVLVGAVFSALACGAYFLVHYAVSLLRSGCAKWKEQQKRRALADWIGAPIVLLLPLAYSLSILSGQKLDYFHWRMWVSILALLGASLCIGALVIRLSDLWRQFKAKPEPKTAPNLYGEHAAQLLYSLTGVLAMIALYAEQTYPYIRSAYGGGQRAPVLLVATARGTEVAKSLGLPINASGHVGPVFVITESETELAVAKQAETGFADKDKAVELRRELLDAIATVDENHASAKKVTANTEPDGAKSANHPPGTSSQPQPASSSHQ